MADNELRKSERVDSLNLLDYVLLDEKGDPINRGMARTLNVSEVGLLLETHISLKMGQWVVITIELEEELVELKGKVVHEGPCDDDKYCSGIEFVEITKQGKKVLAWYLKAFKACQERI